MFFSTGPGNASELEAIENHPQPDPTPWAWSASGQSEGGNFARNSGWVPCWQLQPHCKWAILIPSASLDVDGHKACTPHSIQCFCKTCSHTLTQAQWNKKGSSLHWDSFFEHLRWWGLPTRIRVSFLLSCTNGSWSAPNRIQSMLLQLMSHDQLERARKSTSIC